MTQPAEVPLPSATRLAPIRWGGVVWGLILGFFAAGTLWVLAAPERVAAAERWVSALTPASAWVLAAAALGVIIAVSALLGAIRSAQRRRERELI
ncbi:hypothetical protein [Leifsonia sp. AG29]|uniref:hypothetical protein n=1 Tax=Leifsonia sp. AG29 TaxID=2598860 RepID=UPI00131DAC34|nr:hypothetical protein [Leifsonia sp. AG29]